MTKQWRRQFVVGVGLASFGYLYSVFRQEKQSALKSLRADSQIASVNGNLIEYAVRGEGKPILFIHGGMGGYEQGLSLSEILSLDQFQVIAISRPGHRQTSISLGGTPAEQANTVRMLLDHLGIEQAVILALSAGGLTALEFAINYPDKCSSVVLLSAHGPALKKFQPERYWLVLLDVMMSSDFIVWLMMKVGMWGLLRLMGNTSKELQRNFTSLTDFFKGVFPASDWRVGTMNDVGQVLNMPSMALESIHVPTLILHGTGDVIVPYDVAVDVSNHIPNAQFISVDKGTHVMALTHADEISKAIKAFIANCDDQK